MRKLIARIVTKGINGLFDAFKIKIEDKFLLESFPSFDDQILSIAIELQKRKLSFEVVGNPRHLPTVWKELFPRLTIFNKRSLRYIWSVKTSKYILFTHGSSLGEIRRGNQFVVNLWHGFPIKRVGIGKQFALPKSDIYVSFPGEFSKVNGHESHLQGSRQVLETGLPRIDIARLGKKILAVNSERQESYLWLPTFRNITKGMKGRDGNVGETGFALTHKQIKHFDNYLGQAKSKVKIKSHPLTDICLPAGLENISILQSFDFSLYFELTQWRGVITDYSSIIIDCLYLNIPVFVLAPDLERYEHTRGLNIDIEKDLGLIVNRTIEELEDSLRSGRWRNWKFNFQKPVHSNENDRSISSSIVSYMTGQKCYKGFD